MDVRRAVIAILRAPKRFIDWVYTDTGRTRPPVSDVFAQIDSFGSGIVTARELQEAKDAQGRHIVAALDENEVPRP